MESVAPFPRLASRAQPIDHRITFPLVFLIYTAVAVAYTFPLVLHLSTAVPHDAGDPMLSAAILWWNAHVVPFTARWWNGFAFYPAPGMLGLSDTRLGESLLATPLQWLGLGPVAAYNVTLLATFPLCAAAAHWLAWVITRRHDASAIAALAYAFCPFRVAHLQHLELLGAFGMPVALGALHRFRETGGRRWLALFAGAVVVQALSAGYCALFFTVLLALWIAWFVGFRWRPIAAIGAAAGVAAVALAPLVIGYERIHSYYGLRRPFTEIIDLSGDVASMVQGSSLLALWGWMPSAFGSRPERDLFPGVTIVALAITGGVVAWRRTRSAADPLDRLSRWLLPAGAGFAILAAFEWRVKPWRIALPGLLISSDAPFKPLSLAIVTLVVAFLLTSRVRRAYERTSTLTFYLLASAAMFICSFGPKPAFLGHQFFYEPPYQWLMALPGFEAVRAPARFTMVAMLPLSIAAAIAFTRFCVGGLRRTAIALLLMTGVLADGWMSAMPLAAVPETWPPDRARGFAAVLELPLGDPFGDLAATFRATVHGRPLVNGNSGFEPTHYYTLLTALAEHDASVLDGLPPAGPVLVVVDRRADPQDAWTRWLSTIGAARPLGRDGAWGFFALDPPPAAPPCRGEAVPIAGARVDRGAIDLRTITDGDPHTWWASPSPQRAGTWLSLELSRTRRPCAVLLSVGEFRISYPRALRIETSLDGSSWTTAASMRTAGLTLRAALEDPRTVTLRLPVADGDARFVRLRLEEDHPTIPWIVTDVGVLARGR